MITLLNHPVFYVENGVTYPPFKNGLYLEEYMFDYMYKTERVHDKSGRLYLPILWTNFQIKPWFFQQKEEMQQILNQYICENPCEKGYFVVVQHDDGPMLWLPHNTVIYGACSGNIPIPLVYQDQNKILIQTPRKSFAEKSILCSFIGTLTHNVRRTILDKLYGNSSFIFYTNNSWTDNVSKDNQDFFLKYTVDSKFALAPRGYGRSSFRFFEIYKLGTIPIYVWDDIEWLPYKELIDYSKICISLNISNIGELESILLNIDEVKYAEMWAEYDKIKHMFEVEYIPQYVLNM